MKRIAFLVCVLVLVAANTAEARRNRRSNYVTYAQPVVAPAVAPVAAASESASAADAEDEKDEDAAESAATVAPAPAITYSTATAQGVANIMASRNYVGHFGGNPGYEGCGCGTTPAAAYAICCYANSGMATVDVGYARAANGMWYCCRRYR